MSHASIRAGGGSRRLICSPLLLPLSILTNSIQPPFKFKGVMPKISLYLPLSFHQNKRTLPCGWNNLIHLRDPFFKYVCRPAVCLWQATWNHPPNPYHLPLFLWHVKNQSEHGTISNGGKLLLLRKQGRIIAKTNKVIQTCYVSETSEYVSVCPFKTAQPQC